MADNIQRYSAILAPDDYMKYDDDGWWVRHVDHLADKKKALEDQAKKLTPKTELEL